MDFIHNFLILIDSLRYVIVVIAALCFGAAVALRIGGDSYDG